MKRLKPEGLKVLVVGGGGREHALVWKIKQSPRVAQVFCAPGNAGIAEIAECVSIEAGDVSGLLEFAWKNQIDLTVVGPELPLSKGIVDTFEAHDLLIFGPSQGAAEIEGSKAFAKNLMQKYNIPTAAYGVFTEVEPALAFIDQLAATKTDGGCPCVVKADGLAAGKGVIVAADVEEAKEAVRSMLSGNSFGAAGSRVVIEEFLEGEEVSILAFSDGIHIVPMVSAQDHKRIFDHDQGPNTGGMGAYSPAPVYTEELAPIVEEKVLRPTIAAMEAEGRPYVGVLYAGLMVGAQGVKVLEYNARFGDPETQPVLMRLETDLVDIIQACLEKRLDEQPIRWSEEATVCVVQAAAGYPGDYEKGQVIHGLSPVLPGVAIFHAGTALRDGQIVTQGGRVLGITAKSRNIRSAIELVYSQCAQTGFEGVQYRRDIGRRALEREQR
ncbi:phosphoribosylamine--glycine ligase [Heliophilum fasciatum]|uniref:Phosphoribosylamine--glycine ligase n=1 Tax=Heliophilum fasciatum TaxID=35700 RepID=A0A4R2RG63_9FIRM|nr:phosphoribosylamine--glycine ligase [Heliophilum fasciatum]MCW2278638.1 phosphoribosylamine--glycine ligase [Heliophilum fasciatum]TCP62660.1 phosphoribosylamine--glycine ligase [Heliophilum fasciatum]